MNRKLKYYRSEQLDEILGHPPARLVRSGTLVIVGVFMLLFLCSYLIRYPDQIKASIVITTENPPLPLVARVPGRIDTLFVADSDSVRRGELLGMMQSTTSLLHFRDLKELLNRQDYRDSSLLYLQYPNLGELQTVFSGFQAALRAYHQFLALDYYPRKIRALEDEINAYDPYLESLSGKIDLQSENLQIERSLYRKDSLMFRSGVIAEADYERSRQAYVEQAMLLRNTEVELRTAELARIGKQQILQDLRLQHAEKIKELETLLLERWQQLSSALDQWEQEYLLLAPLTGQVSFTRYWKQNQVVTQGERVLTVVPFETGDPIGRILLPMNRSGKVQSGQEVHIRLKGFPYMEFGMIRGRVQTVSLIPENRHYIVEVALPEGLRTFYNKKLPLHQEMEGTADIITEDLRFLERLINPLKYLWKKNRSTAQKKE